MGANLEPHLKIYTQEIHETEFTTFNDENYIAECLFTRGQYNVYRVKEEESEIVYLLRVVKVVNSEESREMIENVLQRAISVEGDSLVSLHMISYAPSPMFKDTIELLILENPVSVSHCQTLRGLLDKQATYPPNRRRSDTILSLYNVFVQTTHALNLQYEKCPFKPYHGDVNLSTILISLGNDKRPKVTLLDFFGL
jgi:hypothetical protein